MILRLFAISLAIGVPSACSSSLVEKDEGMKPGDDRFYFSLYAEYIALAKAITIGGGRAVGSVGGEPQTAHRKRGCSEGSREADQLKH